MPRKSPPEPRASRSGSYVHESQRHTERVVLRVRPEIAARIHQRATEEGSTLSAYVERLVEQDG